MKVLTVHQPWAELIACGAKRIETRAWNTWYRGPLAIHASKERKFLWSQSVRTDEIDKILLERIKKGQKYDEVILFGNIIAVCNLVAVFGPIPEAHEMSLFQRMNVNIPPPEPELSFGDYTPGRYAWILEDVKRLDVPIPSRGRQRLWDYYFGVDDNNTEPNQQLVKYLEYHKERKHE